MMNLIAIQERFDARAAAALEALVEEVEASGEVRAVTLDVLLVPDRHCGPRGQTVAVSLTLEPSKRGARLVVPASDPDQRQREPQSKAH